MSLSRRTARRVSRIASLILALGCAASSASAASSKSKISPKDLTFEKDVRPILKAHCFECHGEGEKLKGDLDLRLRHTIIKGGEHGSDLIPGQPTKSYLLEQVRSGEMPPRDKKLTPAQIGILEQWIAGGAKVERDEPAALPVGAMEITTKEREHWSFQPIRQPAFPATKSRDRVRTPIDAFLVEAQRARKLSFSPDASRLSLARRAYLDLTGLPPTPEQAEAFVKDPAPDAYEKLVDQLLASPQYGERWGRQWLDVAGYADSDGYTDADTVRPYAYKYRDYVIRSFNADKPFNQFLIEQLAGDELAGAPYPNLTPEKLEQVVATGFLRMGADGTATGGIDQDLARNQVIADTIKIVSTSVLGLSVGCAQCHDHRYDPITQEDYYRIRALFEPAYDWKKWRNPNQRLVSLYTAADRTKAGDVEKEAQALIAERDTKQKEFIEAALVKELEKFPVDQRPLLRAAHETPDAKRTPEQKQLLKSNPSVNITPGLLYQYNQKAADEVKAYDPKIATIRAKKPVEDFVQVLTEVPGQIPVTHLFHRGDHQQLKQPVQPGELSILTPVSGKVQIAEKNPDLPTTGRRLGYAKWLTSDEHPLVARVLVNRVWLGHFGVGLVGTPSDFGFTGERPTNPDLLDWMASEFRKQNWSLKWLHRTIMTSTAYRQSSVRDSKKQAIDPDNRLYWRKPVQRLDAEAVRDSVLAASGVLNPKMFGPPVPVKEDAVGQIVVGIDEKAESNRPGKDIDMGGEENRRSVYVQVRRSRPLAMLNVFDAPVMTVNCEKRTSSTVAPQALMLMNSEFILKQAGLFADRLRREAGDDPDKQLERAWRIAFGRSPNAEEKKLATGLLTGQVAEVERRNRDDHPWQYGHGVYDPTNHVLKTFTPMPHWTGTAWQGGAKLPDAKIGWATLNAGGGHPGNTGFSPVRRWTSPVDGVIEVSGTLGHGSAAGDGVRAWVLHSRQGFLGEWIAQNNNAETTVARIEVKRGDVLDFGVDCRTDENSDSFSWAPNITMLNPGKTARTTVWSAQENFAGPFKPASAGSRALTSLCQALLSANEFLYID
ncbi:MAG TPA: PSD1 and planctomycete cytochrome C domain-containing protein [Roseimicrobium sp.]|nr:PSD1 and planctomycete cytochrome C domain-containing protein [Roseimicrobium sp.]